MTYTTVLSSRVGDIKGLLAAWNDWGKAHVLNESSAIGVAMSQTMLGGDRAGEVNASFQWESIDQAMVGVAALTESTQLAEMYQAHGVTPLRRSLAKVMAVRGMVPPSIRLWLAESSRECTGLPAGLILWTATWKQLRQP